MTKNSWFLSTLENRKITHDCNFDFDIYPYFFEGKSFIDSSKQQAREMMEKYDKIYLSYSGGLDSEFILKIFNDQKLPIIPVLIETPFNTEEVLWAKKYCSTRKIKLEIISLTSEEFINKLKTRSLIKGLPVLLGGLPNIVSDYVSGRGGYLLTGHGDPFGYEKETLLEFCEWDYYLNVYNQKHPGSFLNYSLEVLYSFVKEFDNTIDIQQAKAKLYGLEMRPKLHWSEEFHALQKETMNVDGFSIRKYVYKDEFLKKISDYVN